MAKPQYTSAKNIIYDNNVQSSSKIFKGPKYFVQ